MFGFLHESHRIYAVIQYICDLTCCDARQHWEEVRLPIIAHVRQKNIMCCTLHILLREVDERIFAFSAIRKTKCAQRGPENLPPYPILAKNLHNCGLYKYIYIYMYKHKIFRCYISMSDTTKYPLHTWSM